MKPVITDRDKVPLAQQLAILLFSVFYFAHWFMAPMEAVDWLINLAGFSVFLLLYFIAFNRPRWTLHCAIALVALMFLVAPFNYGANSFAIYACSFFAYNEPPRRAMALVGGTLLTLVGTTLFWDLHPLYFLALTSVIIIGLSASSMIDRQRILHKKRELRSQEEIRRLAQLAERERLGQDLHDLLGHSLTALHLKSQLACKYLQQNSVHQAEQQMAYVQQGLQSALREIRQTLAGVRQHGLEAELEAQQDLCASLGLTLRYTLPPNPLPASLENDLLLILREAITNVLRHAQARHCHIVGRLEQGQLLLVVSDDGQGMSRLDEHAFGNGLTGIHRRLSARGGHLQVRSGKDAPGLTLDMQIPWPVATGLPVEQPIGPHHEPHTPVPG